MLGYPKYNIGDKVKFAIEQYDYTDDGELIKNSLHNNIYSGEIYIIDRFGTFEDDTDVSYDIMVKDKKYISDVNIEGKCLFKHINEKYLID